MDQSLLYRIPELLLPWYQNVKRELPWRSDPSPYHVWLSEIMLQQTRVEAVKPYYIRFLQSLPSIHDLAEAPEEQLYKLWEGLGYYSRVRNLQKAARIVCIEYGGELPASFERLKELPGIGDYTAGAIASIAFGLPEPAVDGNVMRVVSRLTNSSGDIALPAVKKQIEQEVRSVIPLQAPGDFNQALMELGATVCLPNGVPLCGVCPLEPVCQARKKGKELVLPVKSAKKPRRVEEKTLFAIHCGEKIALQKRPDTGLLAKMWELPSAEGNLTRYQAKKYLEGQGFRIGSMCRLKPSRHIFSHIEWHMQAWSVQVKEPAGDFCWIEKDTISQKIAIPSAFGAYAQEWKSL